MFYQWESSLTDSEIASPSPRSRKQDTAAAALGGAIPFRDKTVVVTLWWYGAGRRQDSLLAPIVLD